MLKECLQYHKKRRRSTYTYMCPNHNAKESELSPKTELEPELEPKLEPKPEFEPEFACD